MFYMKNILMHTCCSPCFIMPYNQIKKDFNVTVFWFNHNIHPVSEYYLRLNSLKEYTVAENIEIKEFGKYGLVEFLENIKYDNQNKCSLCYLERLDKTAQYAKSNGFDCFSTSLLYSKRQKHDMIKDIGESLSRKYKIDFYYKDFREFWNKGIKLSKEKNLYRQKYCGCIFSEMDRFKID